MNQTRIAVENGEARLLVGFSLYALDPAASQYAEIARSRLLPDLDFALVARYAVRPDTPQALREFERAIRG